MPRAARGAAWGKRAAATQRRPPRPRRPLFGSGERRTWPAKGAPQAARLAARLHLRLAPVCGRGGALSQLGERGRGGACARTVEVQRLQGGVGLQRLPDRHAARLADVVPCAHPRHGRGREMGPRPVSAAGSGHGGFALRRPQRRVGEGSSRHTAPPATPATALLGGGAQHVARQRCPPSSLTDGEAALAPVCGRGGRSCSRGRGDEGGMRAHCRAPACVGCGWPAASSRLPHRPRCRCRCLCTPRCSRGR